MRIPFTPERQRIDDLTAPALEHHTKWSAVGELPGLSIVDRFSDSSQRYMCYWYVFQHEDWYQQLEASHPLYRERGELLLTRGISSLEKQGYTRLSTPVVNAVVAYQFTRYPSSIAHYGLLVGEDRVRSKFGTGYVYEHPIDCVPNCYGDQVVFFGKNNSSLDI